MKPLDQPCPDSRLARANMANAYSVRLVTI